MKNQEPLSHFEWHFAPGSDLAKAISSTVKPVDHAMQISLERAAQLKPGRELITKEQAALCAFPDLNGIAARFGDGQARVTWIEQFALINTARAGSHVYRVAAPLTAVLQECDFKVEVRSVRPPFQAVYIMWDGCDLNMPYVDGSSYPIEGAYVVHLYEPDSVDGPGWWLYIVPVSRSKVTGASGNMAWFHTRWDPDDDAVVSSDTFAEEIISGFVKHGGRVNCPVRPIINLVVNTLLYLTLPAAELRRVVPEVARHGLHATNPKKRRKAENRVNREAAKKPYFLVGESVQYIRRSALTTGETEKGHRGQLTIRQIVSGHFKTVRYGEGHKLHKVTFIKPYVRGPETAEQTAAVHLAKVLAPKETPCKPPTTPTTAGGAGA